MRQKGQIAGPSALLLIVTILIFIVFLFTTCSKGGGNNSGNTPPSASFQYSGALVGSSGYLSMVLNGAKSYILAKYTDSSRMPVVVIHDSLVTQSLGNWIPGQQALSNVLFTSALNTGMTVTLVSVNVDGTSPVVTMSVPGDPFVKVYVIQSSGSAYPLQVYQGKAVPSGPGVSGGGGGCTCYTKTINFVVNPAAIGASYAAATAIYIDSASHLAGFLNGAINSSNPKAIVSIVNNNDTSGLHVYNGAGGPNSNNGSGYINGTLLISTDGSTITGSVSGMYKPWSGPQSGACGCSYNITATRVQ